MSYQLKVVLVSFAAAILISLLIMLTYSSTRQSAADYFVSFGIIGFFGGLIQLIVGLFLLLLQDKKYAQGYLLSGGILMVVGFTTCTGAFNVH